MTKFDFESITKECEKITTEAYNFAVQKMLEDGHKYEVIANGNTVDYMYDICGGAFIKFCDCRSSFYKEYKKYRLNNNMGDPYGMFREYPSFGRQELSINKAIVEAVNQYLRQAYNVKTIVKTYID